MTSQELIQAEIIETLHIPKEKIVIELYDSLTSTNDVIKPIFQKNHEKIALVATTHQTAGRGRSGKNFYSNLQEGLYFSLAFQPNDTKPENIPLYTILAAASLGKTLEKYLDEPIAIKWVNDIFYKQKKVSGILSEMMPIVENNQKPGIIIGIGINFAGDFTTTDEDVQAVAGTIFGEQLPKYFNSSQFLGEYLNCFMAYHEEFEAKKFMPYYESHLLGKGKTVYYTVNNQEKKGVIKGINEYGHLLVARLDGSTDVLYGQDVHFGSQQFIW